MVGILFTQYNTVVMPPIRNKGPKTDRNWTFTLNNYLQSEIDTIQGTCDTKFIGFCREIAPTTNTPHLHVLLCFREAKSRSQILTLIPRAAKVEPVYKKSSPKLFWAYCNKADPAPWSQGTLPTEERPHLQDQYAETLAFARSGDLQSIRPSHMLRHLPNILTLGRMARDIKLSLPRGTIVGTWIHGPSGTGKSEYAHKLFPNSFLVDMGDKWYDGIDPLVHDTLRFDDVDESHRSLIPLFNKYCNIEPFSVQVKGGTQWIRPRNVVVTSRLSIAEWTAEGKHDIYTSIRRRFTVHNITNSPFVQDFPPSIEVHIPHRDGPGNETNIKEEE